MSHITLVFPQCGLAEFELAFVRSLLATCANTTIESVVLMDHAMEWMDPVAIDRGTPDGIREIHLLNSYDALNKHLLKISNTLDEFLVVGIHSKSNDNLDIESFPNQSYIEFIDICERASMLDVYLNFRQLRLCCDYFTYDIANEKMIDNDACVVVCQLPWAKARYNHMQELAYKRYTKVLSLHENKNIVVPTYIELQPRQRAHLETMGYTLFDPI
jgi:hypothetical protein